MKVFVAGISALDFYRKVYHADRAPGLRGLASSADCDFAYKDEDVWSLLPTWVTPEFTKMENGRIHILTSSPYNRTFSRIRARFDCDGRIGLHSRQLENPS